MISALVVWSSRTVVAKLVTLFPIVVFVFFVF